MHGRACPTAFDRTRGVGFGLFAHVVPCSMEDMIKTTKIIASLFKLSWGDATAPPEQVSYIYQRDSFILSPVTKRARFSSYIHTHTHIYMYRLL